MILLIDNYDSFTYNLVQYVEELGAEVVVRKNDVLNLEDIGEMAPEAIIISPGPSTPEDAGISVAAVSFFHSRIPILGVCLGHQAIARAWGAKVVEADKPMHGKVSRIYHDGRTIYRGLNNPFPAARYHSLVVEEESLPRDLVVSARCDSGEVMGIRHRRYLVEGVQFHPESFMTGEGKQLLANFLQLVREYSR